MARSVRARVVCRSWMRMPLATGSSTKSVTDTGPGSDVVAGSESSAPFRLSTSST
jgi:hypothetical protein